MLARRVLPPPPPPRWRGDVPSLLLGLVLGAIVALSGAVLGAPPPVAMPAVSPPALERAPHPVVAGPEPIVPSFVGDEPPLDCPLQWGASPAVRSPACDLARADGGARVVSASPGWGGGAETSDLVDGERTYHDWANGHAFGGGTGRWMGEACGDRHVEIELAGARRIDRLVAWHHGTAHTPAPSDAHVEILVGDAWQRVEPRTTRLVYDVPSDAGWWADWSRPVEHRFDPVTAQRVRYVLSNCAIEHGWLYEIEIYAVADPGLVHRGP